MITTKNTIYAFALFAFACLAFSSTVRGVDPPPDGGYPNQNTAEGDNALFSLTTGESNTATGFEALFNNTTGFLNTATGNNALTSNTIGGNNTATGNNALFNNTDGGDNTASGSEALGLNTTGVNNTATGFEALFHNTTGNNNIAVGMSAGFLTTGDNNIIIGNNGVEGESGKIRIGTRPIHRNTYIAGISGVTVPSGVGVIIAPNGKLGTVVSSARFKDSIKPMDKASEPILALKPVTFRYKKGLDPAGIAQFGLVAEDVEKVNPDLVARDEQGEPYSVRYEAVNAMLLNEFLKEHRTVQDLKSTVAEQQHQIETLTAGLQKVNAQLGANKLMPQVVNNP